MKNKQELATMSFTLAILVVGFKSRVRYMNVLDPSNTCYYISEVLDAGRDVPLFMVLEISL